MDARREHGRVGKRVAWAAYSTRDQQDRLTEVGRYLDAVLVTGIDVGKDQVRSPRTQ
jgi:hypothetical protein